MSLSRVGWVIVLLGGLTAASSIIASSLGAHAILLAVIATISTAVVALGAYRLQVRQDNKSFAEFQREQQLPLEQELRRSFEERRLDKDCADLLRRAEVAVQEILDSDACTKHLLREPVDREELQKEVEDILAAGKQITHLRKRLRSIAATSSSGQERPSSAESSLGDIRAEYSQRTSTNLDIQPGPMTAEYLKPLQGALAIKLAWVTSRLLKLESYASQVNRVDATYRDLAGVQEAERLNGEFRDLVAGTAKDELAAEELDRRAERVRESAEAFRQSIEEANLAAETLALPGNEEP